MVVTEIKKLLQRLQGEMQKYEEFQFLLPAVSAREKAMSGPLTVMIAGEFSTGKSTFINALLRKKIVQVDATESTAVITKLCYGMTDRSIAHFKDGHTEEITGENFRKATSLQSSEGTAIQQELQYVERTLPIDMLRDITIIDSPGLNSNYVNHLEMTQEYLQKADVVLWLISAAQSAKAEETALIAQRAKVRKPVIILNKIDIFLDNLDDEEDDVDEAEAIAENEAEVLSKLAGNAEQIFSVSAKEAFEAAESQADLSADPGHMQQVYLFLQQEVQKQDQFKVLSFAEHFGIIWYQLIRTMNIEKAQASSYSERIQRAKEYFTLRQIVDTLAGLVQEKLAAVSKMADMYWQALQLLNEENPEEKQKEGFAKLQQITAAYPPAREVLISECLIRKAYSVLLQQLSEWVEKGDTKSRKMLGLLYYYGLGCEEDVEKARELLENSVLSASDKECRIILAYIYGLGQKTAVDLAKSESFLKPLLDQNDAEAFCVLANIYGQMNPPTKKRQFLWLQLPLAGTKKAWQLYDKAVSLGSAEAMYHLFYWYLNGWYVKKDIKQAIALLYAAADRRYGSAMYLLGTFFFEGELIKKDEKAGWQWLVQAADAGVQDAIVFCASCYLFGNYVRQDAERAYQMLLPLANEGNADAAWLCGLCCQEGDGTEKNESQAFTFYKREAKTRGNASYLLGLCYENRIGTPQNFSASLRCFQQAASRGYILAMKKLMVYYRDRKSVV